MSIRSFYRRHAPNFGRRSRIVLGALGLLAGSLVALAAPADATPFACNGTHGFDYCVYVTAIDPGSCLRMHKQPNYTSGYTNSVCLVNGNKLELECYTSGSGDIDGNGDHWWWWVKNYGPYQYAGYVNDWYVTTGSYSQWKALDPPACIPGSGG